MVAELTDNMTFGKVTPVAPEPTPVKTIDLNYIAQNFKL
jgi:hypothetical protein